MHKYSLRPKKQVVLACERCPNENVIVVTSKAVGLLLHSIRRWTTAFGIAKYFYSLSVEKNITTVYVPAKVVNV
jgi:hypothetical protein